MSWKLDYYRVLKSAKHNLLFKPHYHNQQHDHVTSPEATLQLMEDWWPLATIQAIKTCMYLHNLDPKHSTVDDFSVGQ